MDNKQKNGIKTRNPNDVIFYCTIQKAGSQWIHMVLKDKRTFEYTGLEAVPYSFVPNRIQNSLVPEAGNKTFASRLYIDYATYIKIAKPERYKTFYVTRDPRDIVVSWYYSVKQSHPANVLVDELRKKLNDLNEDEGLIYSIRYLASYGAFDAQRSWIGVEKDDRCIATFSYEELVRDELGTFSAIFKHCDIEMPEDVFRSLIADYTFKKSSGRDRGVEDSSSHFRKGVPNDWASHFTNECVRVFKEETGDLLVKQRYEADMNWSVNQRRSIGCEND